MGGVFFYVEKFDPLPATIWGSHVSTLILNSEKKIDDTVMKRKNNVKKWNDYNCDLILETLLIDKYVLYS